MSKSYSVEIDGKAYTLKYGIDERELVEGLFPRPDGTPGSIGDLVRGNLINSGSFRVQCTLVQAGLRHHGKACSYEKVREAMIKATQNGGIGPAFIKPTREAILASGSLGTVVQLPDEEPEEGKA